MARIEFRGRSCLEKVRCLTFRVCVLLVERGSESTRFGEREFLTDSVNVSLLERRDVFLYWSE